MGLTFESALTNNRLAREIGPQDDDYASRQPLNKNTTLTG